MTNSFITPNDYAIHVVEKRMTIDALIIVLYNAPTEKTFNHFKFVNSHLVDGFVKPGQIVLISPINSQKCTEFEQQFQKYADEVDKKLRELDEREREILAKRYELLSNVAKYNGMLLGVANNSWTSHVTQVKTILTDLETAYVNSYNRHGSLKNSHFLQKRKLMFTRLDTALSRFAQPTLGGGLAPGNIRQNLGLSSKSMIHHWKSQGGAAQSIPHFAENYKTVANMAKNLKRVGYVGIALTGVEASANIVKACTEGNTQACTKAKYVESGKAIGAVGGGILGGAVATWATCSIVFGLPSSGTSFFWCAVVAGGSGGYAGGKYGGEYGGSKGEVLYEANGIK
ncbi:hypothetical protein [Pseudoalteromonas prydzensis]|uniref:LysM domain-containing protein n=2 Tax=Pseudoalteromonas prydzensis TaxID=182141 RepID=A0ABR9FKR2_9GAMM|nr:hypothetical protein [Pseudoalteromonas prydzensis]MBE0457413.1 hypothetical protein [Pseudoalteromonas prydzensis]